MPLPPLTIIPAGAGSGKTYTIQKKLSEWVSQGLVSPERIVAVTFTEAAAAELRERIRSELTEAGRVEDALKLDQAYISTIHGFGLRLLTEFAFDAGISPELRLLNEDEEEILIRRSLAATDKADAVLMNLGAFGYRYDFNSGSTAEDQFRGRVMNLIRKLRSITRFEPDDTLLPHALERVKKLYGEMGIADHLEKRLNSTVDVLLKQFPGTLADLYPDNQTASSSLRKNFRDLKKAEEGTALTLDWGLWQRLRDLRTSKRGSPLPDGYDDLAAELMEAASALPRHPGPLAEALAHVEALMAASQDSLARYAQRKKDKGLIDYTDMLALSNQLITGNVGVLSVLRNRVDCVVIDEFQDTNPLQFSLLWALFEADVPVFIVGDLKQSIMGFQEADSRLLAALQEKHPDKCDPLEKNWRSSEGLMEWINCVGAGLFGERYVHLEPQKKYSSNLSPLEVIEYSESPRSQSVSAQHAAVRVKMILENSTVHDKESENPRAILGSDIAVLCPTNAQVARYAAAFRQMGISTRIEEEGWFESRIIQIVYQALSFVEDPSDSHAALYLAVTELGSHNLQDAIEKLLDGKDLDDTVISSLKTVAEGPPDRTVDTLLHQIIVALDLYGEISTWPDASHARADLVRLQAEAAEFLRANREALASGGYYGSGAKSFLAWLKGKIELKDSNRKPTAQIADEDAVRIITWHKSKGLEWPVVFVCGLDRVVAGRLPDLDVIYEDFSDLSRVLEEARIEIYPEFVAPETKEAFLAPLNEREEAEALNELYVALTRAREKVVLEWPTYLDGKDKTTYYSIFRDQTGMRLAGNKIRTNGREFDCRINAGAKVGPPEAENVFELPKDLPVFGRRAIVPCEDPRELTPEAVTPSAMHGEACSVTGEVRIHEYGQALEIALEMTALERGSFLHRCFEIASASHERMRNIPAATGVDVSEEQFEAIHMSIESFDRWIQDHLSPISMDKEVPILALNDEGSVISGYVDLLVETDEGFWIIDHKSDETEDLHERFAHYLAQLACYAEAIGKARKDKPVVGMAINWITSGKISTIVTP